MKAQIGTPRAGRPFRPARLIIEGYVQFCRLRRCSPLGVLVGVLVAVFAVLLMAPPAEAYLTDSACAGQPDTALTMEMATYMQPFEAMPVIKFEGDDFTAQYINC